MSVTATKGGRRIELFLPFTSMGRQIDVVELKPFEFGMTVRWREGRFESAMQMLAELSGLPEPTLHKLCYPDAERVLAEFAAHLPTEISAAIASGELPISVRRDDEGGVDLEALGIARPPAPSPASASAPSPAFDPEPMREAIDRAGGDPDIVDDGGGINFGE